MFEHQERLALILLLGVALIVVAALLILGSLGKPLFAHPYSSGSADGELVVFEGNIDQVSLTNNGGHMLAKSGDLSLFIPAEIVSHTSPKQGDHVVVYGIVQTYKGKKEIVVNSEEDLRIVNSPV